MYSDPLGSWVPQTSAKVPTLNHYTEGLVSFTPHSEDQRSYLAYLCLRTELVCQLLDLAGEVGNSRPVISSTHVPGELPSRYM
jgi:hypothetical protein